MKLKQLSIQNCIFENIKYTDYTLNFSIFEIVCELSVIYSCKLVWLLCKQLCTGDVSLVVNYIKSIDNNLPIEISIVLIKDDNINTITYTIMMYHGKVYSETIHDTETKNTVYWDVDNYSENFNKTGISPILFSTELGLEVVASMKKINYLDDESLDISYLNHTSLKDVISFYTTRQIYKSEEELIDLYNKFIPQLDLSISKITFDKIYFNKHNNISILEPLEFFGSGAHQIIWQLPAVVDSYKNDNTWMIKNLFGHLHILLFKSLKNMVESNINKSGGQIIATTFRNLN